MAAPIIPWLALLSLRVHANDDYNTYILDRSSIIFDNRNSSLDNLPVPFNFAGRIGDHILHPSNYPQTEDQLQELVLRYLHYKERDDAA